MGSIGYSFQPRRETPFPQPYDSVLNTAGFWLVTSPLPVFLNPGSHAGRRVDSWNKGLACLLYLVMQTVMLHPTQFFLPFKCGHPLHQLRPRSHSGLGALIRKETGGKVFFLRKSFLQAMKAYFASGRAPGVECQSSLETASG